MRKFIFNGMNIGYTAPDRAQDVSYNNTESGLSASTTQTAIDELTTVVNGKVDKEEGKGLFSGSYNDLTNKPGVTSKTSAGFCPQLPNETTTTKYLRQDGSWQVPPDNNTTYSAGSNITLSGTTFSLTKANVTGALGYTPPTTNTTYSAGTGMGLSGTSFYLPIPRVAESCNALPGAASLRFREYTAGSNYSLPTNAWYQILEIRSTDTNYGTQLALGMTTNAAYYRNYSGAKWGSWYSLINTNTTYSAGSNITLSGTTFSLTKANVTGALGYTPPTSDTNNAVTVTHSNSNAQYPICWEGHNNTTTYTTGIYKCTSLTVNPYNVYLYVKHTSDASNYTRIGPREVVFFWGNDNAGGIQRTGQQALKFEASNESNYWVYLGVADNTWTMCPDKDSYVKFGSPNHRWNQIYSINATINTSDRNEKKDIIELGDDVKNLIMGLKPVSYKFINGESGRTHYGMIAQDVEETMNKLGITALDFAGFCKDQKYERYTEEIEYDGEITNENGEVEITKQKRTEEKERPIEGEFRYGLRYEEFIAPLIKTVQLQQKELEEKDKRINDLEDRLSKLEALIYK